MKVTYDFVLLDCLNHAHRNWWRHRDSLAGDGRDNGIERGFMEGLHELVQNYPDAQLILARDGEPVGQRTEMPGYKAGRAARHKDRPDDWHPRCDALLLALGHVFPTLYDPADEADREIGRMVRDIAGEARTLIVSTDGDMLMLLSPRVHVLRPGLRREVYTPEDFRSEYDFGPEHFVLYRSLVGDKSDEIPGLPHFPRQVAGRLAAAFGTVDALYRVLTGPIRSPVLEQLTEGQRRKLRDGEGRVRSNARLVDLISANKPPHLSLPSGDLEPLLELLGGRGLGYLAASLDWRSLTGNTANGVSALSVLERIRARVASAPGPAAKPPSPDRGGRRQAPALNQESPVDPLPAACPDGAGLGRDSGVTPPQPGGPEDGDVGPAVAARPETLRPETGGGPPPPRPPTIDADRFLLPSYQARLDRLKQDRAGGNRPVRIIPRAPSYYAGKITFVGDLAGAEAMLDFAKQRAISFVGVDCEFRYGRPGVLIKKDRWWYDPTSVVPLLMAVVLVEAGGDGSAGLYRFVIDLRQTGVLGPLGELIRLPIPFVGHFIQSELFCLWELGLPAPVTVWDTCTAERAFQLGIHHSRYKKEKFDGEGDLARSKEEAEEDVEFSCGLTATCTRRGVPHAFAAHKDRLQHSFLDHADGAPFTDEQVAYTSADAEAAARLYPIQVQAAVTQNAHRHLFEVEMPWTVTNASMIWEGVCADPDLLEQIGEACRRNDEKLTAKLTEMGLANVNSYPDMHEFLRTIGLLEAFRDGRSYTFDDNHLKAVEDRHDAIPTIRALRKIKRLRPDKLLTGELTGSDGRLHPNHRQLGAESGRNTMSHPNIGGIGKALRPLVVPSGSGGSTPPFTGPAHSAGLYDGTPGGWGVGEVDLSQIEVLIAAAESGDRDLIATVNNKDVYCAMVRKFYAESLTFEELALPDKEFGKRLGTHRDVMKIFTLAIIYNITPFGLSHQLGISEQRAAEEQARFLAMFPVLDRALREASAYGAIRGYAQLRTGLRRRRAREGCPTPWEANWLRNTPIQGSASVVFKIAGNRLHRRYQHYGARLILPLHDAYIFECPLVHLEVVGRITAEVMKGSVQEIYPVLDPQVDVNIEQPHCWNKDGKSRSLELWLEDPDLARKYLKS